MKDEIVFFEGKRELVAHLGCEIDHHTSSILRERIDTELFEKRPAILVIDFSKVGFMDSSGLGLILGRVDKAAALGARIEVRGLSDILYKLVHLAGLERVKNLTVRKKEI